MKRFAKIDKVNCVACGVCLNTCKKDAISIYRGCYAVVNEEKCVGCGLCGKACPAGCISVIERGTAQ